MDTQRKFFHQQLFGIYFLFVFVLALLVSSSLLLNQLREHELTVINNHKIPLLEKRLSVQTAFEQTNSLLITLNAIEQADKQTIVQHKALENALRAIERLSNKQNEGFIYLTEKLESQHIERISKNDERNRLLNNDAIIELNKAQILIDNLLSIKKEKIQRLYQLINSTERSVSNRIIASRLYTQLMNEQDQYRIASNYIDALFSGFLKVNLQVADDVIDKLSTNAEALFLWSSGFRQQIIKDSTPLHKQLLNLENMLILEDRILAKWRGHKRLFNNYQILLNNQQQQLSSYKNQMSLEKTHYTTADLPAWLMSVFDKWQIQVRINSQQIQQILLIIVIGALFLLTSLLFFIHRRVKRFTTQTLTMVDKQLSGHEDITCRSIEQQRLKTLISTIVKPRYTDSDYEQLEIKHQQHLSFLCQQHRVAYWQLDVNTDNQLAYELLALASGTEKTSIKSCLPLDEMQKVIAKARWVKQNQQITELIVSTKNGQKFQLVLGYQCSWFGSIAYYSNEADAKVEATEQLPDYHRETHSFVELNNKIIKTLLQSQAQSLTTKTSSPLLYRQLSRLLMWGQDVQLLEKLHEHQLTLQNLPLQPQIHSALTQVSLEKRSHKCYLLFNDKLPSACHVQLDCQLFSTLVSSLSRTLLAQYHQANLILTAQLHDKNTGQYIVAYQFDLITEHSVDGVADLLSPLLDDNSIQSHAIVDVIKAVLIKLHVQELNAVKNEHGYSISFHLPHAQSGEVLVASDDVNLAQQHILLIGDNSYQNLIVQQYLEAIYAKVTCTSDIKEVLHLLSESQIKQHKIDMLVVMPEHNNKHLAVINKAINHLADSHDYKQPKLFVLPGNHIRLNSHKALYKQTCFPLAKLPLQRAITELMMAESLSNQVYSASEVIKHQYVATGIEVLLAVADISKHQVLLQQLQILGFNITLAASGYEMLTLWQSGKYLILLSDFAMSPLLTLNNGKQIKRGVFTLSKPLYQQYQQQWQERDIADKWQLGNIGDDNSFDSLIKSLSSWLVLIEHTELVELSQNIVSKKLLNPVKSKNKAIQTSQQVAFDIQKYANNLAGPEFAVMMLDDYVVENIQHIEKLTYALSVKSYEHIIEHVDALIDNAKVMSAETLLLYCQQLKIQVKQQHYQEAQSFLNDIVAEVERVTAYAESI
jgi:CheY-like chemotaxis protein